MFNIKKCLKSCVCTGVFESCVCTGVFDLIYTCFLLVQATKTCGHGTWAQWSRLEAGIFVFHWPFDPLVGCRTADQCRSRLTDLWRSAHSSALAVKTANICVVLVLRATWEKELSLTIIVIMSVTVQFMVIVFMLCLLQDHKLSHIQYNQYNKMISVQFMKQQQQTLP